VIRKESQGENGIGAFRGECCRFIRGKIPQIGWNQVSLQKDSLLLKGIKNNSYFLHSYVEIFMQFSFIRKKVVKEAYNY